MKFESIPNQENSSNGFLDSAKSKLRKVFLTSAVISNLGIGDTVLGTETPGPDDTEKFPKKEAKAPEEKKIDNKTADPYNTESRELEEDVIEKEYQLFNTPVQAVLTMKWAPEGGIMPFYFNMHENEQTSVDAAKQLMNQTGGRLLELHHGGERLITFEFQGKKYKFDPNRIFTPSGVEQTLKKYNTGTIPVEVQIEIHKFAENLLRDFNVGSEKLVIALHNNTEGDYSIDSYKSGGSESTATQDIYWDPSKDSDNFFYVTSHDDFNELKNLHYNVVLQSKHVPDDGSLSVYAGMHNIRYINPEAQEGKKGEQVKMLGDFEKVIKSLQAKPEIAKL